MNKICWTLRSIPNPNKHVIKNTHETFVPIPGLPESARLARIFPQLTSASLLSITQLCDAGCQAIFDKDTIKIIKDGKTLLTGYRNFVNNLWEITLGSQKTPPPQLPNTKHNYSLYNVFKMSGLSSIINYLHGACFFPVKSTWLAAILRGAFTTWPYITYNAVQKYLLPSPITSKGHIKQTPTKLRSTKKSPSGKPVSSTSHISSKEPKIANILQATINLANKLDRTTPPTLTHQPINNTTWNEHNEESTEEPTEEPTDKPAAEPTAAPRTNEVFIKVVDLQAKVYSDQTGEFQHISSRGYRYLMIFYD